MTEEQQRVVEPLAKFHARLDKEGRVAIPKAIRDAFGLNKNDYVEVIIRKIEVDLNKKQVKVLRQAYLITRMGAKGLIFIPSDLKRQFDLHEKDIVEIILYGFHKFDELVSEKGKHLLNKMQSAGKWSELKPGELPPQIESIDYFSYVFVWV